MTARFMQGLASGILTVASPRFISEYAPVQLQSTLIPMFLLSTAIGGNICMFAAIALPPDKDTEAPLQTETSLPAFTLDGSATIVTVYFSY